MRLAPSQAVKPGTVQLLAEFALPLMNCIRVKVLHLHVLARGPLGAVAISQDYACVQVRSGRHKRHCQRQYYIS